jgi:hypothetical protein
VEVEQLFVGRFGLPDRHLCAAYAQAAVITLAVGVGTLSLTYVAVFGDDVSHDGKNVKTLADAETVPA